MLVRDYRSHCPDWSPGVIVRKEGPVTYLVEVDGLLWKRHIDQIDDLSGARVEVNGANTQSHPIRSHLMSLGNHLYADEQVPEAMSPTKVVQSKPADEKPLPREVEKPKPPTRQSSRIRKPVVKKPVVKLDL